MGEKRRMLTPQERAAKLERELEEARAKAEAADRKRYNVLDEQWAKLVAKRDEITVKLDAIDDEMSEIVERVPALAESRPLHVVDDLTGASSAEAQAV